MTKASQFKILPNRCWQYLRAFLDTTRHWFENLAEYTTLYPLYVQSTQLSSYLGTFTNEIVLSQTENIEFEPAWFPSVGICLCPAYLHLKNMPSSCPLQCAAVCALLRILSGGGFRAAFVFPFSALSISGGNFSFVNGSTSVPSANRGKLEKLALVAIRLNDVRFHWVARLWQFVRSTLGSIAAQMLLASFDNTEFTMEQRAH